MNKNKYLILGIIAIMFIFGCSKASNEPAEDLTEQEATAPLSGQEDVAVTQGQEVPEADEAIAPQAQVTFPIPVQDVQQALKNAGLYAGAVDGVAGPKTKQAIQDFQTQNGLTADGKVGPKTWEKLATYLTVSTEQAPAQGNN